jgi:hypothetical protein
MIACGTPLDGSMVDVAPGSALTVAGSAVDVNGTMSVTVDGQPVAVAADGSFSATISTQFGINFVDVVATDAYGVQTTKACTFLAAHQWADPTVAYGDTISLGLAQGAVDDNARTASINSLGDTLYDVVNSVGMFSALDGALRAANPLKSEGCDQQVCAVFCFCAYSSGIEYQGGSLPGPNTASLTLVPGGVAAAAQVNNIGLNLHVHGDIGPIPYDTSGWVTFSSMQINVTLDAGLSGGHPHMTIRPGTIVTSVGSMSPNFSGLDSWILTHVVIPLAQDSLQKAVSSQLQSYITNNFNSVLDSVVSGLDIESLGTSFNVPRLDGAGNLPLSFSVAMSSLSTTTARMLFGIGTRFTGPFANAYASLGIAIPTGPVLADPMNGSSPVGIAVHSSIFNQVLHALWRANYFVATFDGATLAPGNPAAAGMTLAVTARLPPVAVLTGSSVQLSLGDLDVVVTDPSTSTSITVAFGARAHAAIALTGDDLHFSGITIDELHVSSDAGAWDATEQQTIEDLLHALAQQLVDQSLNNALPALPIPSFPIGSSLTSFGIPVGNLGISSPVLSETPPHFVLRGGLGLQ